MHGPLPKTKTCCWRAGGAGVGGHRPRGQSTRSEGCCSPLGFAEAVGGLTSQSMRFLSVSVACGGEVGGQSCWQTSENPVVLCSLVLGFRICKLDSLRPLHSGLLECAASTLCLEQSRGLGGTGAHRELC